jgi:CRP/FNR family transcriptional regulator, cyclic AMP receptor protein
MTDARYSAKASKTSARRRRQRYRMPAPRPTASHVQQDTNEKKDILAQLSPADRALMLNKSTALTFPRGSHLFVQGSRHAGTFFIRSGLVRTYYVSPDGKELTLAYWSVGDLLGAPDIFGNGMTHVWSGQAVEDTSVLVIDGADFAEIAIERPKLPSLARLVINTLIFKLKWMSILLQLQGTASVSVRLAHLLLKLSAMFGREQQGGTVIEHRFTQDDLANMIGATRQWVSVALRRLRRQGIVRFNRRQLIIQDHQALRRIGKL